jgi:hypothetical protein
MLFITSSCWLLCDPHGPRPRTLGGWSGNGELLDIIFAATVGFVNNQ